MEVVQIRLPSKLLKKIDEQIQHGLYESRSEYIRSKLREVIENDE